LANNIYIRRKTGDMAALMQRTAAPIMRQVANGHIKKNLGLALIATCGAIDFLPFQSNYTGKTNPLQTLCSHLTAHKVQPANLVPDGKPIEETTIYVAPQFKEELGIPPQIIERLKTLCEKNNVDPTPFTDNGGMVALSMGMLRTIAYFASDTACEPQDCIWGTIKPIIHIEHNLLKEEDLPYRIRTRVEGRKKGRPKKKVNII
jgi:hypothetical protein